MPQSRPNISVWRLHKYLIRQRCIANSARQPLHNGLVYSWRIPSSRTGRNEYSAAGLLFHEKHCSEVAAVASRHHMGPIIKKHDVIHKTGSTKRIATSPYNDRATATGNIHRKFGGLWTCGSWLQTDTICIQTACSETSQNRLLRFLSVCTAIHLFWIGHGLSIRRRHGRISVRLGQDF